MALPYVRDMEAAYGHPVDVAPGIRRVLAHNPGPFTFLGTGTYIVGRGEVAVIDPGPDDPAHLDALLRALQGERIAAILVTHTHVDHSPLAAALASATGASMYGLPAPATAGPERDDVGFRPDVEPAEGDRVAGPGWTLEALHTPGHASNHLAWAYLEEGALFPGDLVMGWSTSVVSPPDGDMDAFMASLDKVAARDARVFYPAHGPPIHAPGPFVAALRQHRLDRERLIVDALARGASSAHRLVPRVYGRLDPRLRAAAAQSLLAHLIRLRRAGRVTAVQDGTDAETEFSLAS